MRPGRELRIPAPGSGQGRGGCAGAGRGARMRATGAMAARWCGLWSRRRRGGGIGAVAAQRGGARGRAGCQGRGCSGVLRARHGPARRADLGGGGRGGGRLARRAPGHRGLLGARQPDRPDQHRLYQRVGRDRPGCRGVGRGRRGPGSPAVGAVPAAVAGPPPGTERPSTDSPGLYGHQGRPLQDRSQDRSGPARTAPGPAGPRGTLPGEAEADRGNVPASPGPGSVGRRPGPGKELSRPVRRPGPGTAGGGRSPRPPRRRPASGR
jgi:hypothetical protein